MWLRGPGARAPTTGRRGHRRALLFVLVVAGGLLVTTAAAGLETTRAHQARRSTFGRDAEATQRLFVALADELVAEFQAGLDYIGATHPQPPSQYADYFSRQLEFENEYDPGIFFVEKVPVGRIPDLEQRERAFGVDDFRVLSMTPAATSGEALIITRTGQEVTGQFPLHGLDITAGAGLLMIDELPRSGLNLRITESQPILAFSTLSQAQVSEAMGAGVIPATVVFLGGEVRSADNTLLGWAFRLLDPQVLVHLLRDQESPEGLNLRITGAETADPLVLLGDDEGASETPSGLYELRTFETASQQWSLEVWAAEDYWPVVGTFEQTRIWLTGLGLSILAATLTVGWWTYRHRLRDKDFELEHARTLATTDALTGLLNRQGFIDTARTRRPGTASILLFIDLDGFKAINDQRGHDAGDRVLVAVAAKLRQACRPTDLIGRLGGDEFVVLADMSGIDAGVMANRIINQVSEVDDSIGCSVGVARSGPGRHVDVKLLIRLADQRMYEAKRWGGNRYALA